jgi:hypothetical protein
MKKGKKQKSSTIRGSGFSIIIGGRHFAGDTWNIETWLQLGLCLFFEIYF